jgi:hypothetical protein
MIVDFFVRTAAARANDFFDAYNTEILTMAIDNILELDKLMSTFGASALPSNINDFRIASASLSVAEKVLKNIPVIGSLGGDFIGLASAVTALIGLTTGELLFTATVAYVLTLWRGQDPLRLIWPKSRKTSPISFTRSS